jgi:hypothetical protein
MAAVGLKLLFDENFSHKHVGFVANESRLCHMQHIRKIGWSAQPDEFWIPKAVEQGFVIVTWDRNEKTRKYTVADLKRMNARVLLIGGFFDHLGRWEKAKWLVNGVEQIASLAGAMNPGSVHLVYKNMKAFPQ